MAAINDADYDSVTVPIIFTKSSSCGDERIYAVLAGADLRVNIPRTTTLSGGAFASSEANNLTRIDSEGGVYTPAVKQAIIQEVTLNLGESTPPGEEVVRSIPVPGISDLANAMKDIIVVLSPIDAAVNVSKSVSGNNLRIGVTRVNYGQTSPYTPVSISIRGVVYEFPQPEPAA